MSSIQGPSLHYRIIRSELEDALALINDFTEENINEIYKTVDGKNCIHLILDKRPTELAKKILDKLIQLTIDFKKTSKLQKSKLFLLALASEHKEYIEYLLKNRATLLNEEEVSSCFYSIVEKNLIERSEIFLKNLDQKYYQWISKCSVGKKTSPYIQSVQKDRIRLFEIFLSYLTKIEENENQETKIFEFQPNQETILHALAKATSGTVFFRKIVNSQIKNQKKLLFETFVHIDDKNTEGKTPIYIASEEGNKDMVQTLLEYGADCTIPSLEKMYTSPQMQYKTPKDIAKNNIIKEILQEAEYGFFVPAKQISDAFQDIMKKRKQSGLLQCCRDGRLKNAMELIKNQKLDPFIVDADDENKSLPMITIHPKNSFKQITEFIDFLVKEEKINFEQTNKKGDNLLTFVLNPNPYNPFFFYPKHEELAVYLIEKYHTKFDLNHCNHQKETALKLAARLTNKQPIKSLLKFSSTIDFNKDHQAKETMTSLLELIDEFKNRNKTQDESPPKKNKSTFNSSIKLPWSQVTTAAKELYDEYSKNVSIEIEKQKAAKKRS